MEDTGTDFIRRNGASGLFLRYARARVAGFWARQVMTGIGALAIGVLGQAWLGWAALSLALAGETVDCLTLHHIARRTGDEVAPAARRLAMLTAGLQSLTITGCVWLCWHFIPVTEARVFAAVFLSSAATNAGLVRRHFPEGGRLRLAVFGLGGAAMLGQMLSGAGALNQSGLFLLLAFAVMAYTSAVFIGAVERGSRARTRFEAALLDERAALRDSQAALADEARRAQRLALVARHAHDSVVFTSASGRIEWVNEGFTRITGYSFDEAVGRVPGELLNGPDTSAESLRLLVQAQAARQPLRLELLNRARDGRPIWMDIAMTPVLKPDGTLDVFIAVERDVTEARRHAAELAAARQAAEAAARAKAEFLATMSHEIRTPLHGVIGLAELLGDTPLTSEQAGYVQTIVESGRALTAIVNDVLDLSKLQAGRVSMEDRPFALADCLQGAVDLVAPAAARKGLTLAAPPPAGWPLHLGDAGRLRQVLLNILGNAVKFTDHGGVMVSCTRQDDGGADLITLAVADTGIGIPPGQQDQIFDSFTQADGSISRRYGGTGLGLTISRLIARQMGGDITAAPAPGAGSVFTITLRLARAPQAVATAPPPPAPRPATALRVLLAEDNRTNMLIATRLLEPAVAEIIAARDGIEAVQAYRTRPPDLVLMDLSMPGLDGLGAARAIRAHEAEAGLPRCPIHALTAFSADDQRAAVIAAGMDGILTKPLLRAALYDLIAAIPARAPGASGFDAGPASVLDRGKPEGAEWSISPQGCITTTGRSTPSCGRLSTQISTSC